MNDNSFEEDNSKLTGLGGWLIIIGISIVLSPFAILLKLINFHLPLFLDGTFTSLTSSGSEFYTAGFGFFLFFEILGNLLTMLVCIYLTFLFFRKSMSFPRIFIFYRAAYALFICLNLVFAKLVFPSEVILDPLTLRELLGALIGAAIMIPYMLKSRRVKLTFIT